MTKTLTEQWKDMDLADGHLYYWRMPNGEVRIMNKLSVYSYRLCYDGGKIEILAPVPAYDEHKRLQERLEIATKALKETKEKLLHVELSGLDGDNRQKMYDLMFEDGVIDKALKEMEGVK